MVSFYKEEVPFFKYLVFFISGIGLSVFGGTQPNTLYLLIWLALFFILIAFLMITKQRKRYHYHWIAGLLIGILFSVSGMIFTNAHKEIYWPRHFSKIPSTHLIVVVNETPRIKNDIARFTVKVTSAINANSSIQDADGKLLLAMRFDTTHHFSLDYGDQLLIRSKYKETEPPYNPGEFNYKRFLAAKQVYHQSFINIKETRKIAEDKGNPLTAKALEFREAQVEKFKKYIPFKNSQSVASTLILGYRAELDQQIVDAYQKTGTLHILSVSGMHVAIVVIMLNFLFKPLKKYRYGKIFKLLAMLSLIWFYSVITGLAPSILRAALMLSFMLLAKYLSTKSNIYNVIAISAFIILLADPFSLVDVGFQLSFLAVLGLVYFHPKIYNLYRPNHKVLDLAWQCASVSIAAQTATTPISLFYFHQFPIYFIISNLFMALPAAIIMYAGIGFLLFSFCPWLMETLGYALNYIIDFINIGLLYIEHFPYATISNVWFSKTEMFLLYATLFAIMFNRSKHKKILWAGIFLLSFSGLRSFYSISHIKQHQTAFFALRKNTAVAYIKGRNALLITDLDSTEYTYRFSVKPFLDSCRVVNVKHINPHQQEGEKIYHFAHKKLKIVNHKQNSFNSSESDWLLLSGDKSYDIIKLKKHLATKHVLIDGRNKDYIIKNLEEQLSQLDIPLVTLKRSSALVINLD